ncbi:alpha/beta hydrolase-fold protein, partial [Escherichia coli]|uniref:alpha/beta hydrolase-fold protein n=8 Tax=Escherichia coli TaxID=562 RepID=UPI001FCEFAA2
RTAVNDFMDSVHHIWCPLFSQEFQDLPDGAETTLTVLALRNPDEYVSVSAFSPIVSPSQVPWGQQAFAAYLGENKDAWLNYDPVSLISQGQRVAEIMVDQGLSDDFYAEQLRTPNLEKICQEMNIKTLIRYHEGYDHSYYFVSSFIGEHIAYHANKLNMR